LRAIVQIDYTAGSKIITIRSDRVVKNHTSCDLEVSLLFQGIRQDHIYPLPSGSDFPIPIDVEFDEISVRPSPSHSWSELRRRPESQFGVMFCNSTASREQWACNATVPDDEEDHWLNLYPPCHFENLLPAPVTVNLISTSTKQSLLSQTLDPGDTLEHFLFANRNMKDVALYIQMEGYKESKPSHVFGEVEGSLAKDCKKFSVSGLDHRKVRILGDQFTDPKTR
jgi:hypothetical protein